LREAGIPLVDFSTDWDRAANRRLFFDAGHASDLLVDADKKTIAARVERVGDLHAMFNRFAATDPSFDQQQAEAISIP
jgi:hypothetical protein